LVQEAERKRMAAIPSASVVFGMEAVVERAARLAARQGVTEEIRSMAVPVAGALRAVLAAFL
jgi:hypothetical protein